MFAVACMYTLSSDSLSIETNHTIIVVPVLPASSAANAAARWNHHPDRPSYIYHEP